ncbi:transcriptional regulator ArgR [Pseudomonas saudimassiliensis]|uniref:Transcriptional regulator ArgR n=2 Tax=Pseudomonas saudimassiliensis TaxID=1461581 RepID=A0A078MJ00_9PSED|nr:transcriptional regulator ArgR [Pseudomonas saudimassiliensis]CEF27644.1 transcriptional regulator ArgR [Pseudomonas saudimassiliensis]
MGVSTAASGLMNAAEARRMAFLVWPGCHPAILMPALAVLRSANRMAETGLYLIDCFTLDDEPILSPEGWQLPARRWEGAEALSHLWLVADAERLPVSMSPTMVLQLRSLAREGVHLGGLEEGVFPLAMAGLLDGHRCAVHWRMLEEFRERFPAVQAGTRLFEQDEGRLSSSGCAITDLFLTLVGEHHGADLAALVAEDLNVERVRDGSEQQRVPLRNRLGSTHPKLTQAVILMESNIEEPLTTDEIARHVCVSRRQLERIFKQYLNSVPSQYYLELRLNRARQMLQQTSKSIIQIGLSCGFSSGPHFSSAYRNCFGVTPREDRNQYRAQQAQDGRASL